MKQIFDWNIEQLSKNQKKIANFIEKNLKRLPYLTEQEIAKELKISIASVSRFWKVIDYKNFKEFKQSLGEDYDITPAHKMQSLITKVEGEDLPTNMLGLGIQYLTETSSKLSRDNFNKAVEAIHEARHIHIFAPGISIGLGQLLQFRLKRYGLLINLIEKGGNEIFETLMHLNNQDLLIVFAFSTISREAKIILDFAKKIGYTTLFITDFLVSETIENADIVLYSYRGQMWEFHSMVAPTVLVESLIVGVGMKDKEASLEKLEYLNKLRKEYASFLAR